MSSKVNAQTQKAAISIVLRVLDAVCAFGESQLEVPAMAHGAEIDSHVEEDVVLTAAHIDKIEGALRENGSAKTWKFPTTT